MSLAPKSNALYAAYEHAKSDAVKQLGRAGAACDPQCADPLDAGTGLRQGYQYAHDAPDKLTTIQCLPDSLLGRVYYAPTEEGLEARYKARLEQIKTWKKEHDAP